MAGGVKLSLIPDVSKMLAATTDVGEAFDDVADSLDGMAREATKAGRTTGDAIVKGGERGEDALDDLGRGFKDLVRDASKASKQVGDDLGDATEHGTRKAAESVGEFKDEARANFAETAASFSGDMSSASDLVQGTLGGLAGSLPGPVGIISGLLAGIGGAWLASMQKSAEANKELINNLTADMIESGHKVASESFINAALLAITTGADDAAVSFKDLQDAVALTGIGTGDLARAYVGDVDAINKATESIGTQIEDAWDKAHNGPIAERQYWVTVAEQLQAVDDRLQGVATATDSAAARAKVYQEGVRAGGDAAAAAADQARGRLDAVGAALDRLNGKKVVVDVDLSPAERTLRNWRPSVDVEGMFHAGRAVK